MSDPVQAVNLYAAPRARLADAAAEGAVAAPFFPVGIQKLLVMSLLTFNLYLIYWFYRNWRAVRNFGKRSPNAVLGGVFYYFSAYWLFRRMRVKSLAIGEALEFPAGGIAWMLLLFAVVSVLPSGWYLLSFCAASALVPVQREVNAINAKLAPNLDANEGYSGLNIAGMLAGGLLLLLNLVGLLMQR